MGFGFCKAQWNADISRHLPDAKDAIEQQGRHQPFFGDGCKVLALSDAGYYLGCELILQACKRLPRGCLYAKKSRKEDVE